MRYIILLLITSFILGCGIKFNSVQFTKDVPDSFKDRVVYNDESGLMKYKLTQLVGCVLYEKAPSGHYDMTKVILKKDYEPKLEIIDDANGKIFEGTINQSASIKGSYLSFAASFAENEIATFLIRDRNLVFIDRNDIPDSLLKVEAETPKNDPTKKRYWVRGVILSSIDASCYTEISSNQSGVVGPTVGVEGTVYNKSGREINDYRISLCLLNLDNYSAKTTKSMDSLSVFKHFDIRVFNDAKNKEIKMEKIQ
jgi:hypothetical protein